MAVDDRFLLHIGGVHEALRLDGILLPAMFPRGRGRPQIAFPLWSRRELVGFTVYSAHRNGSILDPQEADAIERVGTAATAAFDLVDALALRKLTEELAAVRAELRSVLGAMP